MKFTKKLMLGLVIAFCTTTVYASHDDFPEFLKPSATPRFVVGQNVGQNAYIIAGQSKALFKQVMAYEVTQKDLVCQAVARCQTDYEQAVSVAETENQKEEAGTQFNLGKVCSLKAYWQTKESLLKSVISSVISHPELHELYKQEETNVKSIINLYHSQLNDQDRLFKQRVVMCHQQYAHDKEVYYYEGKPYLPYEICGIEELNDYLQARTNLNGSFLQHVMPVLDPTIGFTSKN